MSKYEGSDGDKLYQQALSILSSLDSEEPYLVKRDHKKLPDDMEQVFLLEDAIRMFVRLIIPNEFLWAGNVLELFKKRTGIVSKSEGSLDDNNSELEDASLDSLPVINADDSPALKRAKSVQFLRIAGYKFENHDALKLLGDLFLFKKYGHPRNATIAFQHYLKLADYGNATAQRLVGTMLATGIGQERDYPKALIFMSFAALGKDDLAHQTLAYWNHAGVAVPKNCNHAAYHYGEVAKNVVKRYRNGPPGGESWKIHRKRLSDAEGGIYGSGASGSGDPTRKLKNSALSQQDILTFYRLQAESGDVESQLTVGQFYHQGSDTIPRDYAKALQYFHLAANQHPGMKAVSAPDASYSVRKAAQAASEAAGNLGKMYWRGEGVEPDEATARKWFERGAAQGNSASLNGLGMMHLRGSAGLEKSIPKAVRYFQDAVNKDNADAMVNLAEHYMESPMVDWNRVSSLLTKAAHHGHILAYYYLADMFLKGQGVPVNCQTALPYLKSVTEKGQLIDSSIKKAEAAYTNIDTETAFLYYAFAAEAGSEIAQTNAAWLLDRGYCLSC